MMLGAVGRTFAEMWMSRLGIERQNGLVYEGSQNPSNLAVPPPLISLCKLIEQPSDLGQLPTAVDYAPFPWVFREDSFDPVSRIRRGRLYQNLLQRSWSVETVSAHPFLPGDGGALNVAGRLQKELTVFIECTELFTKPSRGEGSQLAIGTGTSHSLWRILQVEQTVNKDTLLTLRAESAFGILPRLEYSSIPLSAHGVIREAYERVLAVAFRDSPTSVVDQCRNLCAVLLNHYMVFHGGNEPLLHNDLGPAIKEFSRQYPARRLQITSSDIVNLLHPRGKDNEREKHGFREVTAADAELALHATAFLIKDLGWGH